MNYGRIMKEDLGANVIVGTPRYPGAEYEGYPYEVVAYKSMDTSKIANGYRTGNPLAMRDVEKMVKQHNAPKKEEKKKQDLTQYQLQFDEYAQKLTEALGVKVAVTLKDKNTGRLEIDFYNTDDFEHLYDKLK